MLPNSSKILNKRLSQLCEAVKRIYASQFYQEPKSMMKISSHRQDEEKNLEMINNSQKLSELSLGEIITEKSSLIEQIENFCNDQKLKNNEK